VTGIALLALGIGCWPDSTAHCGMLTYGALATLYLAYLGVIGEWVGKLLWPAVFLHGILTVLLARACFQSQINQNNRTKKHETKIKPTAN
jgi:hypothetical protein